jgi:hypothetical protein
MESIEKLSETLKKKDSMYKGYSPWNLEKHLRLENCHAMQWKDSSRMRKNRPICGALCRDGHACKARAVVQKLTGLPINGRCRNHGGLSTGARSPEGKIRSKEAARMGMLKYWEHKKRPMQID